jgi:hypothetical protein
LCHLQSLPLCHCPAIFSKTPRDFSRRARLANASTEHIHGTRECVDSQARLRRADPTLCLRLRRLPFLTVTAVLRRSFDRILIRSEDQRTFGVSERIAIHVFRDCTEDQLESACCKKGAICQLSPGRHCRPSRFQLLPSACSLLAKSPTGSAFPWITCKHTPHGGIHASLRCASAPAITDGRCCGFGAKTLRSSFSTTWANQHHCAGERRRASSVRPSCE